jgi:hypothetical protein
MGVHSSFIRRLRTGAGWAAALVIFGLAGCSNLNNPLGSSGPDAVSPSGQVAEQSESAGILTKLDGGGLSLARDISARWGGILSLQDAGDADERYYYALVIPPGALPHNLRITMTLSSEGTATIDFGPEGLEFAKPVRLIMVIDPALRQTGIKGKLDIYWYDPNTGAWVAQGGQVSRSIAGKILGVVNINHFSRYSLGGDSPTP